LRRTGRRRVALCGAATSAWEILLKKSKIKLRRKPREMNFLMLARRLKCFVGILFAFQALLGSAVH
jgi:PIN domain nuclease of toxin-antitoxin system